MAIPLGRLWPVPRHAGEVGQVAGLRNQQRRTLARWTEIPRRIPRHLPQDDPRLSAGLFQIRRHRHRHLGHRRTRLDLRRPGWSGQRRQRPAPRKSRRLHQLHGRHLGISLLDLLRRQRLAAGRGHRIRRQGQPARTLDQLQGRHRPPPLRLQQSAVSHQFPDVSRTRVGSGGQSGPNARPSERSRQLPPRNPNDGRIRQRTGRVIHHPRPDDRRGMGTAGRMHPLGPGEPAPAGRQPLDRRRSRKTRDLRLRRMEPDRWRHDHPAQPG